MNKFYIWVGLCLKGSGHRLKFCCREQDGRLVAAKAAAWACGASAILLAGPQLAPVSCCLQKMRFFHPHGKVLHSISWEWKERRWDHSCECWWRMWEAGGVWRALDELELDHSWSGRATITMVQNPTSSSASKDTCSGVVFHHFRDSSHKWRSGEWSGVLAQCQCSACVYRLQSGFWKIRDILEPPWHLTADCDLLLEYVLDDNRKIFHIHQGLERVVNPNSPRDNCCDVGQLVVRRLVTYIFTLI